MEYHALHTLSVPGLPFQVVVKVLGEPSPIVGPSSSSSSDALAGAGYGDARLLQRKDKVLRSKGFSRVLVGYVRSLLCGGRGVRGEHLL